jgi:hypothetical protein
MNFKISHENEYQMMEQFFRTGGTIESMPAELLRVRRIWKRADELVRKYPYYNNEQIANQLIADLPEYNLALSSAKNHVTYAKKYFDFVETETPATHRRILTTILYKQIALLQEVQKKQGINAHNIAKSIELITNRIASMNKVYNEEIAVEEQTGDIFIMLSEKDLFFPDIPKISDKELYKIIDEITDCVDITNVEKQKIIDKDVKGNII